MTEAAALVRALESPAEIPASVAAIDAYLENEQLRRRLSRA